MTQVGRNKHPWTQLVDRNRTEWGQSRTGGMGLRQDRTGPCSRWVAGISRGTASSRRSGRAYIDQDAWRADGPSQRSVFRSSQACLKGRLSRCPRQPRPLPVKNFPSEISPSEICCACVSLMATRASTAAAACRAARRT
eukprot:168137-Chlamydomonas_euryale.AAC.7